ncbi:MAG: rubrerythrin family protein [Desulfobulbaceae bacterium]|nr:rubrerythrin family protein [Desulfobulbaceae bacterium]
MATLKGSRTEANLLTAFAGESQARNRYDFFAKQANKEGLIQISAIFTQTAAQEKEHAKRLFKFLEGGELEITAVFPAGVIGSTLENLEASAAGENHEHEQMYPEFARIAKEEGFNEISSTFRAIGVAEKQHEKQYRDFITKLKNGVLFKRDGSVIWYCANCGYLHEGVEPPAKCPACNHDQGYFHPHVELG